MSNEQNQQPDPMNRPPQQWQPPAHPQPSQQQPVQPQQQYPPRPTYQQSGPSFQQSAYPPRPAYPSYQQSGATSTSTRPPQKRGGAQVAGVLAIAMLAAGVGGGTGFVASRYAAEDAAAPGITSTTPSAGPSTETTEDASGGQQTTVVQGDPTNPDWSAVAEVASKSVVAIQVTGGDGGSQGSGVVIDGDGHIATNNHVVASAGTGAQITVLLGNTAYQAEAVGFDPSTDLAVIKMIDPPVDLAVMGYGDSRKLVVGDPVMAIGNPLGLADTVTTGIVSALNRPVTTRAVSNETVAQQTSDSVVVTAAIQTNAAINPGNSGGALVNSAGELVGITSSIASIPSPGQNQAGNIGIGFAIGSDQVQYVAEQLIATGRAEHPQLGVSASDVQSYGPLGAEIVQVVPGSPAEQAGIAVGDQITQVDGQPVSSTESLVALVRAGRVGEEMEITLLRGGQETKVAVTPIAAPN
ncbi:S1C family serine protease [Tessaracoccus sp. Y36]